jgi:hypothetical protein
MIADWRFSWKKWQLVAAQIRFIHADRVRNPAAEDSQEEWQTRLRSLEQWICELLIKNQQLRWALMEMEQLKSMSNTK